MEISKSYNKKKHPSNPMPAYNSIHPISLKPPMHVHSVPDSTEQVNYHSSDQGSSTLRRCITKPTNQYFSACNHKTSSQKVFQTMTREIARKIGRELMYYVFYRLRICFMVLKEARCGSFINNKSRIYCIMFFNLLRDMVEQNAKSMWYSSVRLICALL